MESLKKFFIMSGPNVIESEEHTMSMARKLKDIYSKYDIQYYFKGNLSISGYKEGYKEIYIFIVDSSTTLVYAHLYLGPLAGAGYIGKIKHNNNRWIVVKWDMIWIS